MDQIQAKSLAQLALINKEGAEDLKRQLALAFCA